MARPTRSSSSTSRVPAVPRSCSPVRTSAAAPLGNTPHGRWASYGFRAILSESFADIFYANCCQNGILPVRLLPTEMTELFRRYGGSGRLLQAHGEPHDSRGDRRGRVPGHLQMDDYRRDALLKWLDEIGRTMLLEPRIALYERRRAALPGSNRRMTPASHRGPARRRIGPEVVAAGIQVLLAAGDRFGLRFDLSEYPMGAAGVSKHGDPFPEVTRVGVQQAEAVLLGARWGSFTRFGSTRAQAGDRPVGAPGSARRLRQSPAGGHSCTARRLLTASS